jgi:hypothetical protein
MLLRTSVAVPSAELSPSAATSCALEEPARAHLQALDSRRRHGFGPEEQPSNSVRVDRAARLPVEAMDFALSVGDVGGGRVAERDRTAQEGVGHVGLVLAAAAIAARQARGDTRDPLKLDQLRHVVRAINEP